MQELNHDKYMSFDLNIEYDQKLLLPMSEAVKLLEILGTHAQILRKNHKMEVPEIQDMGMNAISVQFVSAQMLREYQLKNAITP